MTATMNRRSVLTGAAVVAVCGTASASASGPQPDAALRLLADRWFATDDAINTTTFESDEDADTACGQLDPLVNGIITTPAEGFAGIHAKLRVFERLSGKALRPGDLAAEIALSVIADVERLARA